MLDGSDSDRWSRFTMSLVSVDDEGWPHIALLSVGEVLAVDERRLVMALWPGSTTTRSLTPEGRATLACVVGETAYSVHLDVHRGDDLPAGSMDHAWFECAVRESLADTVTYARLTTGIEFELPDRARVLERWHAVIDAMRERVG